MEDARALGLVARSNGTERIATLRSEMARSMEDGCGIYRTAATMQATCDKLAELKQRYKRVQVDEHSKAWNTESLLAIALGYLLDVAQCIAVSAINRRESRGSHQRLDGFEARDDLNFLKHSLAYYNGDDAPRIRLRACENCQLAARYAGLRCGRREGGCRLKALEGVHA
jgi:fumarate reductase flavoprotein subunit